MGASSKSAAGSPSSKSAVAAAGTASSAAAASTIPPGVSAPSPSGATSVPVSVVPLSESTDKDVRRLTRIILSDIVIYSPERADKAIREGRFPELYRAEIEEGRKMIRTRFPGVSGAIEAYERSLHDLIDARRKELQEAASAL